MSGTDEYGIRTDAADDLPYEDRSVTFLRIVNGHLEACQDRAAKREWLAIRAPMYAAWTGQYRTDIFTLNHDAARKALKMS